ncbi:uncharacterized protein LOC119674925 [Teleopsis dalmanni]|uniref:uncharacterized protein LOC119674925 n=1 Tax=Teleopsis dalmanni TaxID=139649 RepID=UPI0018CE6DCA|nr:uncharacterized protein LOC119674925 [Teleopsis dalmanni]
MVCSCWIPHHLTKSQKVLVSIGAHKCSKEYNGGASKVVRVYKIVTRDEACIYAYEPKCKQQSYQDKPNPTKFVRARSTSKQMIACFFGKLDHVATTPTISLQERKIISSKWHTTICFPEVFSKMRKINKSRLIIQPF